MQYRNKKKGNKPDKIEKSKEKRFSTACFKYKNECDKLFCEQCRK